MWQESYTNNWKRPSVCATELRALAAAGCAWSARGATVGSGRGWLGAVVARQADWAQRPVRVDGGLSYTTVQAIVACVTYWAIKSWLIFHPTLLMLRYAVGLPGKNREARK